MRALTTKLFRDLANMRGAVFTIALVVAAGIAAFVTLRGTWLSIVRSRDQYYSAERFGDVFAHLERAPNALEEKLAGIPGVARVYTRVVGSARVPMEVLPEPAQAQVISIPTFGEPPLNGLKLLSGRLPSSDRDDEALLIEMFAANHHVKPGDVLTVIIEGRERSIRVVGIAMSPEFVLAVPGGAQAPAPERFAVFWMPRPAVEAAFDLRAAFNDVVLDLSPGSDVRGAIVKLDALLDRYGCRGAVGRERQLSNYFLTQDIAMLATMATVAPLIFLAVAAFLLNVVLSRLVELDRPQIATLKAIGYSDREVGLHYLELTTLIVFAGLALGLGPGMLLGQKMTALYSLFYRMPNLAFRMTSDLAASAVVATVIAGVVGAALSVRRVALLPPAEAMRPAAPPTYRRGLLGSVLVAWLGAMARMVAREILRRPMRTMLSALGIAAATGIVVVGQFFSDATTYLVDVYLPTAQRESIAITFVNPVPEATAHALRALPGVRDVQWGTGMQVRVRAAQRERLVMLMGHAPRHDMRPILDEHGVETSIRPGEVLLTETLAKVLGVTPGGRIVVEPLEGERTRHELTVTGTETSLTGLWIHMTADDMHRMLGQAPTITEAMLRVDRDAWPAVQEKLKDMPLVASAMRADLLIGEIRKQTSATGTFSLIMTLFAVTIAISVVYNNARVALSLRARELASLRVLGFTRGEISSILISELAVQVLLGIPLGLAFGKLLSRGMLATSDPENFRFPPELAGHTYAVAALVTMCAAIGSALLVRRKLDKLDLIEVLKTRE